MLTAELRQSICGWYSMLKQMISVSIIFCALMIAGCNEAPTSPSPTTEKAKPFRVLLVMKSLVNPFYIELQRGAELAAAESGIELIVKSGTNETLVPQQIDIIEQQLKLGVDAIVIAPADSVRIIPVLKQAIQSGISVVNIDNRIDQDALARSGLEPIPFVSVDNHQGGYLAAEYLSRGVEQATSALIIEGPRAAENARQRRDGARQAFDEAEQITVVASEQANWHLDQAYAVIKRVHALHPDLSLVFCANDMMALGAALYLQENNLQQIKIAGYDNVPDARSAIEQGLMVATIDQQAFQQGYVGVQTVVSLLNKQKVKDSVLVDVKLITTTEL
ncbi:sugar ABC transporter substrate-binding protein [Corallincola spongiicola]|uniref:Sugar ABC transporter substrate-binding protein n=2 Tax=Corallincola spongiicola TaxID=2520508 RepID=A0ABY1WRD7_9GAMM|nr:sugar ABC transporter substrate-binding protein [Corallincola spongiicola]